MGDGKPCELERNSEPVCAPESAASEGAQSPAAPRQQDSVWGRADHWQLRRVTQRVRRRRRGRRGRGGRAGPETDYQPSSGKRRHHWGTVASLNPLEPDPPHPTHNSTEGHCLLSCMCLCLPTSISHSPTVFCRFCPLHSPVMIPWVLLLLWISGHGEFFSHVKVAHSSHCGVLVWLLCVTCWLGSASLDPISCPWSLCLCYHATCFVFISNCV